MSEASKRTLAWREQKRQEGYQPVTIWIPARLKNAMVNLGFQRHQDLGELIAEAYQAWSPAKAEKLTAPVDQRRLEAIIKPLIAEALARAESAPPPAPEVAAPRPVAPTGMKVCRKGHAPYPAHKAECPTCTRERKREHRQRKAAARRGDLPA
jgi:hypothetical protein